MIVADPNAKDPKLRQSDFNHDGKVDHDDVVYFEAHMKELGGDVYDLTNLEKNGGNLTAADLLAFQKAGGHLSPSELFRLQKEGVTLTAADLKTYLAQGGKLTVSDLSTFLKNGGKLNIQDLKDLKAAGMDIKVEDLVHLQAMGADISGRDLIAEQATFGLPTAQQLLEIQRHGGTVTAEDFNTLAQSGGKVTAEDIIKFQEQGGTVTANDIEQYKTDKITFTDEQIKSLEDGGMDHKSPIPPGATKQDILDMIARGEKVSFKDIMNAKGPDGKPLFNHDDIMDLAKKMPLTVDDIKYAMDNGIVFNGDDIRELAEKDGVHFSAEDLVVLKKYYGIVIYKDDLTAILDACNTTLTEAQYQYLDPPGDDPKYLGPKSKSNDTYNNSSNNNNPQLSPM